MPFFSLITLLKVVLQMLQSNISNDHISWTFPKYIFFDSCAAFASLYQWFLNVIMHQNPWRACENRFLGSTLSRLWAWEFAFPTSSPLTPMLLVWGLKFQSRVLIILFLRALVWLSWAWFPNTDSLWHFGSHFLVPFSSRWLSARVNSPTTLEAI